MHKEIYLIRSSGNEDYAAFSMRIKAIVAFVAESFKPDGLRYTITENAPPALSIIPFSRKKIAVISVYHNQSTPVHNFIDLDGFDGAYRVTEALPVAYQKDWPDGSPTPGACLLTLFSKKKNIDYQTFIDRWHNSHTPMSLRYHPLWNYNRNVVEERLTEDTVSFDGIVEEQVRTPSDLLNPFKFFGNPIVILPRMLNVYMDTKSFINYPTMETYLAAEYVVKSM